MQIGHNKVFLRRRVFETLEYLRTRHLGLSAILIQKHVRRFKVQQRYIDLYVATLTLQCFARRISAYRKYNMLLVSKSATRIQAQWRRFLAETELIAARLIAHFCQAFVRGIMARKLFSMIRVENQALLIQSCWRRHQFRVVYVKRKWASVIIQCFWRQKLAINEFRYLRREARKLGTVAKERDLLKEESLQLRQEVDRLRTSGGLSQIESGDVEILRLRKEIERLQAALSVQGSNMEAPSQSKKTRQGWLFGSGGGDDASLVSTGSFSIPAIKRVFSRSDANDASISPNKTNSSPSFPQDAVSPGMSSNISLLDTIGDNEVADYQLNSVADTSANNSGILTMPPAIIERKFPLSERRGLNFCRDLQRLHDSIRNDDLRSLDRILYDAADPHVLVNEADDKGHTALHTAIASENFKAARLLLQQGSIVNAQDNLGQTPLHLAMGAPMTTLLLEVGNANPNIPNIDGICALHLAVQRKEAGSVRLLLKHGAKVDTADNIKWFTPLHVVALPDANNISNDKVNLRARKLIVDMLCHLDGPSKPDVNDQDNDGNTPLHYAVQIETEDACHVVNTLLQNGADPRISNSRNQQPLLLLCHNNALRLHYSFQESLHAILFHGANPNQQSDTGCTPLHLSLFHQDIESAVQLVNRAAELHLMWRKVSHLQVYRIYVKSHSNLLLFIS
jgi:ankyrin repeat protein